MKVVERFKRRILDLAIRGKLVPQDPNDEPASELLVRIRAEKAKDERVGRGRKGKRSAVGSDGAAYEKLGNGVLSHAEAQRRGEGERVSSSPVDAPFELPDGWVWCKLGDVLLSLHTGLNPRQFFKLNTPDANNYYVTIRELKNNQVTFSSRTDKINDTALYLCNKRSNLEAGDVLFGGTGSIGATALVSTTPVNWNIKEGVYALKPEQLAILPHFLLYLLQAPTIKKLYLEQAVGATVLSVPMKEMNALPIPLPPLTEQKRIVARIEELFKIADSLGEAADGLEVAAKRLDKKILDLAIRGKLVPQDPTDEPASELLKRIAAASHKSPFKNQDAPIDPPFEIPESWVWIKLGSLVNIISGVSYTKDAMRETGIRILRGGNLDEHAELSLHDDDVFVSADYYDMNNEVHSGDIVIVASTGSSKVIGRPAIARSDLPGVHIGAFLRIVRSNYAETAKWIAVIFRGSYYRAHIQKMSKGTNIKNLKAAYISELQIPLPPLEEQKRIVAKIEELRKVTQMLTM